MPEAETVRDLRPDLVALGETSRRALVLDVAVPFETSGDALDVAESRKLEKYAPIREDLEAQGYQVTLGAFVVGSLGSWRPSTSTLLQQLGVSKAYLRLFERLCVSDAIRWSRDIYVEHVTGQRMYRD